MSEYLIQEKSLTDIADAIREKAGSADVMTPAEMVEAILGIQAGGTISKSGSVVLADSISLGGNPIFGQVDPAFSIEHGLGEKPDIFIFVKKDPMSAYNTGLELLVYFSMLRNENNLPCYIAIMFSGGDINSSWRQAKKAPWEANEDMSYCWPITEETFPLPQIKLTGTNFYLEATEYLWFAIGGLSA